jgi:JmjC domain.
LIVEKTRVEVEYAADLPSRKYGSGFPTIYRAKATDELDPSDERTHPFNLNNISHAKDSMFQIITRKMENISGISSPWVYSGMLFASFCWHVEDLYMYSLNYMHLGAPKTWFFIASTFLKF